MQQKVNTGGVDTIEFDELPEQVATDIPFDLLFSVKPTHPSNQLLVEYQVNGEEKPILRAYPTGVDALNNYQRFRVSVPGLQDGESSVFAPFVMRAGMVVGKLPTRSTLGVAERNSNPHDNRVTNSSEKAGVARFHWSTEFLGAFTVKLINPPEYIGPGPDGLRINYFIESGEIRGPRFNGTVSGGDWMSLRPDGVGEAESRITYETSDGARILSRYTGIFDLGPEGYERAKRNDFDAFPPLVMTPTFTTSHPSWLWLNRLQCLAVGRAKMDDLTVYLDIYAVNAGQLIGCSKSLAPVRSG